MEGVLPQERQPSLYRFGMTIFYLYKPPERDPFKILLAFCMDEVTTGHRPPFDETGERHWPRRGEVKIIGCAEGEVCEELDVADVVRSKLKVAHREAVLRLSSQRF